MLSLLSDAVFIFNNLGGTSIESSNDPVADVVAQEQGHNDTMPPCEDNMARVPAVSHPDFWA